MRTPIRWQLTGVVGVGVLGLPLLPLLRAVPPTPALKMMDASESPVPHIPQGALHQAAFWLALANYKMAGIGEGIHARYLQGATVGEGFAETGAGVARNVEAGLAALPAGKQYQAWVIPPGGVPQPEPVFSPDASGSGSVDIPSAPIKGALVAVTVEPAGGSQQPTSKPFLVATID